MTSKTSCFEPALFRRDLRRAVPLVVLFALIWIVAMPAVLVQYEYTELERLRLVIQDHILVVGHALGIFSSFVYGLAAAWMMFFYLFSGKSANFYAALPVRRGTQFCTHYVAGLSIHVLPMLAIMLLTWVVTLVQGVPMFGVCMQAFAENVLQFLFFYNFGVLCCMIVGSAVVMPLIYAVLNFAVPVLETVLRLLLQAFVYGMPNNFETVTRFLSPVWYLVTDCGVHTVFDPQTNDVTAYTFDGWMYCIAIAAAGIVIGLLALALYRRREMERCGDVIAVRRLRPVFLYAFTFGCALVLGVFVTVLVTNGQIQGNLPATMIFMVLGAAIGYLAAQMLLLKTMHVMRRAWRGLLVCSVVVVVFLVGVRLDLAGYSSYIPDMADIASVSLGHARDNQPVEDAQVISDVVALHTRLISDRETIRASYQDYPDSENGWWKYLNICYTLENGNTVRRRYAVYCSEDSARDQQSILNQLNAVLSSDAVILASATPGFPVRETNIADCTFTGPSRYDEENGWIYETYTLSTHEAYALYTQGIMEDLTSSSLGSSYTAYYAPVAYTVQDTGDEGVRTMEQNSIDFAFSDLQGHTRYYTYQLTADAVNTIRCLRSFGYLSE